MKGFGGIVIAFAIVAAAALLLTINTTTINSYSYKELLPQAKQTIANYELVLNQAAGDCNWELSNAQIRSCITQKATTLFSEINETNGIKCILGTMQAEADNNTYHFDLNCTSGTVIGSNNKMNLKISQKIFVGKTNKYRELKTTDPLFNGVAGIWHLNGEGTDYSGNEKHASTITATPTTDRYTNSNGAYSFDKTQTVFIQKPFTAETILAGATISVWVKMQNTSNPIKAPIIDFYSNTSGGHGASIVQKKSDQITFDMGSGVSDTRNSTTTLTENWVHLVMTYDGTTLTTYINGADDSKPKNGAILMNDYNLSIGYSPDSGTRDFSGSIDEVVIWNRALSTNEVGALYNRQKTP